MEALSQALVSVVSLPGRRGHQYCHPSDNPYRITSRGSRRARGWSRSPTSGCLGTGIARRMLGMISRTGRILHWPYGLEFARFASWRTSLFGFSACSLAVS